MQLQVNQPNLAAALGIVGRAVSSRSTMPVLSNILLDANDPDCLRLSATNREIAITCWIPATVADTGAITIPARLLTEFINSLPPERIDMELTARTQTLHLSCARFEANMKGIDALEFPAIMSMAQVLETQDANVTQVSLPLPTLRGAINRTVFAASTDDNRPTLTGVEVVLDTDSLAMGATDGYRASMNTLTIDDGPTKTTVVIPARSLGELAVISKQVGDNEPVRCLVTPNRNQIMFAMTGGSNGIQSIEMVSELIDARFPDYRATIPKSHSTRAVIDTASLLKAVRVALLFARDNANIVRFTFTPDIGDESGKVQLSASGAEIGDNASELPCSVDGDRIDIAFDGSFVIDVLSRIDAPQVVIDMAAPTRPATFRPVGDDGFLHMVMPMTPPNSSKG